MSNNMNEKIMSKAEEYRQRAYQKIIKKIKEKTNGKMKDSETKDVANEIFDKTDLLLTNITDMPSPLDLEDQNFNEWLFLNAIVSLYQTLGDTIGYNNGKWEMNSGYTRVDAETANDMIYDYISLGGINDMSIVSWIASDDTILYMATFDVLCDDIPTIDIYGTKLRQAYIDAVPTMTGRHPGAMTMKSLSNQEFIAWNKLPYNPNATGSGSAMRAGCIGIFYPGRANRKRLIALAVECSRITHNSATAILGSITSALFTSYALERVHVAIWPHKLLKTLRSDKIDKYMKASRPDEYNFFVRDKVLFYSQWEKYVNKRFSGLTPLLDIKMFKHPVLRIKYFAENFSKGHMNFPGGDADDAVIMAYDALLESGESLEKLIVYSMLHHGDSDTVGSIAMSWFGAIYNSPKNMDIVTPLLQELEFEPRIIKKVFDKNSPFLEKMTKTYYHDMYLHFGYKMIDEIISRSPY